MSPATENRTMIMSKPVQVVLLFLIPGFFQGPCGWVVHPHHNHQSDLLGTLINFLSLNICMSLRACGVQATENTENLEIPKACGWGTR